MDADFSHPPECIKRLIEAIDDGNDIAVASRYCRGGSAKPNTNSNESSLSNTLSRFQIIAYSLSSACLFMTLQVVLLQSKNTY